jgi:hypothetical protein
MKKLLSSVNVAEIGLLKSLLEADGIACATRNEHISMASGSVPFVDCYPELWVLNDEDFEKAQTLVARWQGREMQPFEAWQCPECGEEIEGQFASCWKCGHMIDEQTRPES